MLESANVEASPDIIGVLRVMGLLVDGVWVDKWYDTKSTGGAFVRGKAAFRSWVTGGGAPGPTGAGGFKAEPGSLSSLRFARLLGRIGR